MITVEPVTLGIGALVGGVDLKTDLDDATFADVHAAWMKYLVVFFHDQQLTVGDIEGWQADWVAIGDNRCAQHMALWDYFPETRSGYRATVSAV